MRTSYNNSQKGTTRMKTLTSLSIAMLLAAAPAIGYAEETRPAALDASTTASKTEKKKPKKGTSKKPAVKEVGNANCPVGGAPVGSMQPGSHIVYDGYKVGLCCDSCKGRFMSDPAAYLKKAQGN